VESVERGTEEGIHRKRISIQYNRAWKEEEGLKNKTGRERDKIKEIS
jgi:hypothetical protein